VKVYDSQANFIFIKVRNATKLNKYLLSNGIIVRTLDNYEIFDCLRISIGTTLENKKFLNLIKKFFENE
jgi:histidinol-phosphate aminotransferase